MSDLDRLAQAVQLFLDYRADPIPREAWLDANADYRDLLEPMLDDLEDGESSPESLESEPSMPASENHFEVPVVRIQRNAETGAVESLGPYRVVRPLGEGGMGTVYLAEQTEPIQRQVALKVIRRGMESRTAISRFETERQALAQMDHPNIARVLDAGTTTDRCPYFVMELVSGERMTDHCDAQSLSIRGRVKLFAQVCDGVHHAHQNGIVHRDLKPSNVLVSVVDGKAIPKIIDFGIAKVIGNEFEEQATLVTETGSLLGTPAFMSPEQLDRSGDPIDVRTDVYSLGVLLYELLAGRLPFDNETRTPAGFADLYQMVRDVDPPRPSTRVSSLSDTAIEMAARRSISVRNWQRGLEGELDWIVLRCLEKERDRRYDGASTLAQDLRRYLDNEPVLAGPPSRWYRARKFVRRNRGLVSAAALIGMSLVVGLGWALIEKSRADDRAVELSKQAYRANLTIAARDLNDGRLPSARRHLDETVPELRGWEWKYFEAQLEPSFDRFDISPQEFTSGNVDASGQLLALGLAHGVIQVLDVRTRDVLMEVETPGVPTHCSIDTRSGRLAALGSHVIDDGVEPAEVPFWVSTWDLSSGESTSTRTLDGAPALGLRGNIIIDRGWTHVVGDVDAASGKVVLCTPRGLEVSDLETGEIVAERSIGERLPRLEFSPSGRYVILTEKYANIEFVDATTLERKALLAGADLWGSAVSPDESRFAAGLGHGGLAIWDLSAALATNELVRPRVFDSGHGAARRLLFTADSRTLISVGDGGLTKSWNTQSWALSQNYPALTDGVHWLAAIPRTREFFSVEENGVFRFWSGDRSGPAVLRGHESFVYHVDVDLERGLIATGGWDGFQDRPGAFRLWDLESGDPVATWSGKDTWSEGLCFVPERGSLLTWAMLHPRGRDHPDERQLGSRVDLDSGTAHNTVRIGTPVMSWQRSRAGDAVWAIDALGEFLEIDPRTGSSKTLDTPWEKSWGAFRIAIDEEHEVAAVAKAGVLSLRRFGGDWAVLRALENHEHVITTLDFDPTGERLLSASEDGTVVIWDVKSGEKIETIGHDVGVLSAQFHPRGERIATGARDGVVRIFSGESYEPLASLRGHEKYVQQVIWQPDGGRLFSASGDGTVRIWETTPVRERMRARKKRSALVDKLTPIVEQWFATGGEPSDFARFLQSSNLTAREEQVARQLFLGRRLTVESH